MSKTLIDLPGPSRMESVEVSPFMTQEEAASLLHMTVAALRKRLERGTALGMELLPMIVKLDERTRYFKRALFMDWLRSKSQ